jgi:hypothetical protein
VHTAQRVGSREATYGSRQRQGYDVEAADTVTMAIVVPEAAESRRRCHWRRSAAALASMRASELSASHAVATLGTKSVARAARLDCARLAAMRARWPPMKERDGRHVVGDRGEAIWRLGNSKIF